MRSKRLAATAFMAVMLFSPGPAHCEPLPTIAITFDHYRSTYDVAFPIMKRYGIAATFFVDPRFVDANGGPTSVELREMQRAGWEIGAYSGWSLYRRYVDAGERAARDDLANIFVSLALKGFPAVSLAPASRAWSEELGIISRRYFDNVRVIDLNYLPQHAIVDSHFIRDGWTPTLSAADTPETLREMVRKLIAEGGLKTIVIHEVGNDSNPGNSVTKEALEAMCRTIASERVESRLLTATFDEAVRLWSAKRDPSSVSPNLAH
jgi:peptidoglycan/xylan/chitin deacetylase (PgdA/CDA1 family)